ncbi:MAG: deoxynucleoside kinase [Bacteroidota bacterium]
MQHNFIAIEGNIGAGKTSLCTMLANEFNYRLVLEQFSDNPFLPMFYENPEQHAFTVELFFMSERYQQLQDVLANQELFSEGTIADYFFIKTLLFAQKNLKGEEFRLFHRLFDILNARFPKPDLLVYLHRSVDKLLSNIRKRGRGYEQEIPAEYLQNIQDAYLDYFKLENDVPILILDLENLDFVANEEDYQAIKHELNQPYSKGVYRKKMN